jgi:hypothetical protein
MKHSVVIDSLPQAYDVIEEMNLDTDNPYKDNIIIDMRKTFVYKNRPIHKIVELELYQTAHTEIYNGKSTAHQARRRKRGCSPAV